MLIPAFDKVFHIGVLATEINQQRRINMAINNSVTLKGNMGSDARTHFDKEGKEFASVNIATTDSYKNESGEWIEKETVWHNIMAFSPTVIAFLRNLKKGSRIEVEGSLSYRPFDVVNGEGEVITKKEVTIIARKVQQVPLVKKNTKPNTTPEAA